MNKNSDGYKVVKNLLKMGRVCINYNLQKNQMKICREI